MGLENENDEIENVAELSDEQLIEEMSKREICFFETGILLKELFGRFQNCIFIGEVPVDKRNSGYLVRWQGSKPAVVGLMEAYKIGLIDQFFDKNKGETE